MELLGQLIEQLPLPAQLWDMRGAPVATNAAFNGLFHLAADCDWAERGLLDDPQLSDDARAMLRRSLSGYPVDLAALPYRLDDRGEGAESLRLFMRLRPLAAEDGRRAVLCLITDHAIVAERLEQDLMRSQRMENVETLASGVAHEFNNIFTGIRGLTELIKDQVPKDSDLAEFAGLIDRNVMRGAELIQKLSSFARELPHSLKRRGFGDYLRAALPLLHLQAPKKLSIELDIEQDAEVMLDAGRMDQALASLISNARDATDGAGRVRISLAPLDAPPGDDRRWLCLEVADDGPGIPEAQRSRVVEPFFTTKEPGRGTGLGLAMTARIAGLHGGRLEVGRSEALGGAAIRLCLPAAE